MTHIDLNAVVAHLHEMGDTTAYVEHTGGGCATIYAGGVLGQVDGEDIWSCLAGPGTFLDKSGGMSADTEEFFIGPEGEDSHHMEWPNDAGAHVSPTEGASARDIAEMILRKSRESAEAWPSVKRTRPVTITLTPGALDYLSMLVDIDDDPDNAEAAGIDYDVWEQTRALIVAAASGANR